jgi:hypothetical protein
MNRILTFLIIILSVASGLFAQEGTEGKMAFFADVMINADEKAHRITAHRAFKPLVEKALQDPESFDIPFSSLKWISIQYPQDSSFRIFSWQLRLDENNFEYYGYIQKSDGTVFNLKEGNEETVDLPYMLLRPEEWVGCLYYKIHQFGHEEKTKYVLFGYKANDKYERIKYADILNFDEDNTTFGSPVFVDLDSLGRGDVLNRIILQYSADSNVNLNYNSGLDMIVFDNLIPVQGRLDGQGPTFVSDGSYKGYKLAENGTWEYIDKIFDHKYEEAPRPKPVLNAEDKERGIEGRKRKN